MSIESVVERRGYDHSYDFGQYAPNRQYTRYFWVYSTVVDEDPLVVRAASGVPQPNAVHPSDTGCIVQHMRVRRDEEVPKRWDVECIYSNETRQGEKDPPETIADYIKISVSTRQGQRLLERDINDVAITNKAGDLIEGVTVPWNALQLVIEQFVTTEPNYYVASKWINAINSATWRGVPAYFARITGITYNIDVYEGTKCWKRVTTVDLAHIDAQPWGWRERILNAGLRELIDFGDGPVLCRMRDPGTASYLSKPVPLTTGGIRADAGDENYIDFQVYPEFAFSGLGI